MNDTSGTNQHKDRSDAHLRASAQSDAPKEASNKQWRVVALHKRKSDKHQHVRYGRICPPQEIVVSTTDRIGTIIQAGLLIVGLVGAYIFWRQLNAMTLQGDVLQGQLGAMQNGERPWVGISAYSITPPGDPPTFSVTLKNFGTGPARLGNSYAAWGAAPPYVLSPNYTPGINSTGASVAVIFPGQTIGPSPEHLEPLAITLLAPGAPVYVYLHLEYDDLIGYTTHYSNFCWVYGKDKEWDYCLGYNEAD